MNTELSQLTKPMLLERCKQLGIKGYSSKNKTELIDMIIAKQGIPQNVVVNVEPVLEPVVDPVTEPSASLGPPTGLRFIDLFCGVGGFHQALSQLNGTCVFACDIDEKCRDVYEANYGLRPHGDITKVNVNGIPDFDILCGGFPCFMPGTLVLTNNGYKKIEDVQLSDQLMTHTGAFQTILNTQQKLYTGKIYMVHIKYRKTPILCTPEHPFYVRTRKRVWNLITGDYDIECGEPEWKKACDLTTDDYFGMVVHEKDYYTPLIYSEIQKNYNMHQDHDVTNNNPFVRSIASVHNGVKYYWDCLLQLDTIHVTNTPVYNFEVESDNSYIVENTIVHNCQSFSNGGKKKGFSDDRGNLFEYILKIAVTKRPSFLFLENVKHIKKIDNGTVFTHILKRINESGYHVDEKTVFELSPHQLGVPQQRERVIFVCVRADIYDANKVVVIDPPYTPIDMDSVVEKDTTATQKYRISAETEQILNIWDEMVQLMEVGESLSPTILCNEFNSVYDVIEWNALPDWKREYITKNKPIYNKYKEDWDAWYESYKDILQQKEVYGKLEWQAGKKKENDSIFHHFIQFRQSGIRVKKSEYFPTLVAIVQTPIFAKEKRYITPRECARLQSFPDTFKIHKNDHTAYKQFGNAVNVKVVHYVMEHTLRLYGLV